MYPIISVLISVVGALLFVFSKKIAKANKTLLIFMKVLGGALVVFGLVALYMLLSGKITLPIA